MTRSVRLAPTIGIFTVRGICITAGQGHDCLVVSAADVRRGFLVRDVGCAAAAAVWLLGPAAGGDELPSRHQSPQRVHEPTGGALRRYSGTTAVEELARQRDERQRS